MQDCIGVTYTATQSILGLFKLKVNYSSNCFSKSARLHRSYLYSNLVNTGTISAKLQDCIGVTYTATQSILGLFKLDVNYLSNCFSKSARLHRSYLYSNSVNTGTISANVQDWHRSHKLQQSCLHRNSILGLFKLEVNYIIKFVSAKVQDCIGVTYTATQSTLELFKLEVDYSSTSFWQK